MLKQRLKVLELRALHGLMTMSLTLKKLPSLTRAIIALESFWNPGTLITPNANNNSYPIQGQYSIFNKNALFILFHIIVLFSHICIFRFSFYRLFIILPVEGCSSNS